MPGGAESVIHWRATVVEAARQGIIDPVVIADLDMKNYFNTPEWPSIREAIREGFAEAAPIVEWEQAQPGKTILPDGAEFEFDRGAEQGEPLGAIKSALPLGRAREQASTDAGGMGAVDEWYIDDGQPICKPEC